MNDLLSLSTHLTEDGNKPITFAGVENKMSILNFKTDVF